MLSESGYRDFASLFNRSKNVSISASLCLEKCDMRNVKMLIYQYLFIKKMYDDVRCGMAQSLSQSIVEFNALVCVIVESTTARLVQYAAVRVHGGREGRGCGGRAQEAYRILSRDSLFGTSRRCRAKRIPRRGGVHYGATTRRCLGTGSHFLEKSETHFALVFSG